MKRLIFTVTTGRSGTDYLARLLESVPGVDSRHEPRPSFVWAMRDAQLDPDSARRFWVEQKLPAIDRLPERIYAETSHIVCKGFIEPLLELGHVPDLILLRRPHRQVAASMYRLNTIPGRTYKGVRWYLTPDDPGVLPLPGWKDLHDYQLCYWYCLEIERRRQLYGPMVRAMGARVVEVDLLELTRMEGFRRLRSELELPRSFDPRRWLQIRRRIGVRSNKQAGSKRDLSLPEDVERLEAEVEERSRGAADASEERSTAAETRPPRLRTRSSREAGPTPAAPVSVVVSAGSGPNAVNETVASVLNQTVAPLQVLVVGTPPAAIPVLQADLARFGERVTVLGARPGGPGAARNAGIQQARGELIAFIEAGDTWVPQFLEAQTELLRSEEADMVYTDAVLSGNSATAGQTVMELRPSRGEVTFEALALGECSVVGSCVVARKESLVDIGLFDPDLERAEDLDLWLRLAYFGGRIRYRTRVLARCRGEGIESVDPSSASEASRSAEARVCRKILDTLELSPEQRTALQHRLSALDSGGEPVETSGGLVRRLLAPLTRASG